MKKISDNIFLGKNIINNSILDLEKFDKILLFSNKKIFNLYGNDIINSLNKINIDHFEMEDGERYKNIETVLEVIKFMKEKNYTRKSLIICLGGGVVCDTGGFIASIFMRGIDFIQIPTSLLAQVDASIGGKVAVNFDDVKNLIGNFKNPLKVIIDTKFLSTLDKQDFLSGMSEIIKHTFLAENENYLKFLEKLDSNDEDSVIKMIEESIKIKKYYVDNDEKEENIRAFLNFGHTYAHVIESYFHYTGISHGEAVAKGVIFELELSILKGYIKDDILKRAKNIFEKFGIASNPLNIDDKILFELAKSDKKNNFNNVIMICFKDFGKFEKVSVNTKDIAKIINKYKFNDLKASIDIGTNSCRLFIGEFFRNKCVKIYANKLEVIRLGEGVDKNKSLKHEAIERCLATLTKYKKIIDNFKIKDKNIFCFATSATRDSSNRDIFIDKIYKNTGIKINCISGNKEAEYNFLGVVSDIDTDTDIFIVDIGGGSTEFTYGNKKEGIIFSKSVDIGSVRITEQFLEDNSYDKLKKAYEKTLEKLKLELSYFLKKYSNKKFKVYGVAGTITTQISVRDSIANYERDKIHNKELFYDELSSNIEKYLNFIGKESIVGLDKKREDVIVGGSIILRAIYDLFNIKKITVSENDNLTGAILKELI